MASIPLNNRFQNPAIVDLIAIAQPAAYAGEGARMALLRAARKQAWQREQRLTLLRSVCAGLAFCCVVAGSLYSQHAGSSPAVQELAVEVHQPEQSLAPQAIGTWDHVVAVMESRNALRQLLPPVAARG
ncbi:MAG: hypothetical protein KDA78_06045 [Planctomycetaceae bacterium]|nr:hypothetical protein [Planctomycetaceae bacterium]